MPWIGGYSGLHSKFQASLRYRVRPCLKQKQKNVNSFSFLIFSFTFFPCNGSSDIHRNGLWLVCLFSGSCAYSWYSTIVTTFVSQFRSSFVTMLLVLPFSFICILMMKYFREKNQSPMNFKNTFKRDGSAVKNAYCSFEGPEFSSQHPH